MAVVEEEFLSADLVAVPLAERTELAAAVAADSDGQSFRDWKKELRQRKMKLAAADLHSAAEGNDL